MKCADHLFERVLRRLYGTIRHEVEHTSRRLERIEGAAFSGQERHIVREVSETGRVLLRFETTLKRHQEPLHGMLASLSDPQFFGAAWPVHAAQIEAERAHVADLVSSYRQVATELRDTNDSLLSASQNEVMKTLTIVTFIMYPLSLIAALFQMALPGTPLEGDPSAFWVVIGLMLAVSGLLTLFIVKKGWL